MTVMNPNARVSPAPKVIRVSRDIIEGAKLQVTLDRRRGRTTSPIIRKMAQAKSAR